MAAPLPRYDELGIRVASPGGIATPGAGAAATASAQAAQTLVDNMNRLTAFAFKEAEESARARGAEYGAANAPTPEQIRVAAASGATIDVGSLDTTFGRAARKTAIDVASTNMQAEALQKMAVARQKALLDNAAPEALQGELDAIVSGYGSAMGKVSAVGEASLRASLATHANSTYLAYLEKATQKEQARQKVVAQSTADLLIQSIDDDIAAGNRVDPKTGAVTTVDQIIDLKRVQILKMAAAAADPDMAATKLKQLNEAVKKAKVSTIARWTQDESGVPTPDKFHQVMTGNFAEETDAMSPEQKSKLATTKSLWKTMSPGEQTDAQDEVRRQIKAKLEMDAANEAAATRARSQAQSGARIAFRKAWMSGDTAEQDAQLKRMEQLGDSEGFEKHAALLSQKYEFTGPGVLLDLERRMVRGTLTEDHVIDLVTRRELSEADARATVSKLDTVRDRNFQTAMSFVKGELGYPDKGIIRIGNDADRKAEQQVARIQNALIEAKRTNPDVDVYEMAKREVQSIKTAGPSQDEIRAARSQVEGLKTLLGLKGEVPPDQLRQALSAEITKGARGKFPNPNTAQVYRGALDLLDKLGPQK